MNAINLINTSHITSFQSTKYLQFLDNGKALLHSTQIPYKAFSFSPKNAAVAVWDIEDYQLRFTCPGVLIGKSLNGDSFLTYNPIDAFNLDMENFRVWDVKTGKEIELRNINPNSYSFHQRAFVFPHDYTQNRHFLIYDVLNAHLSQPISLSEIKGPHGSPDSWALSPNGKYLITTLSGTNRGHDWAKGVALEIEVNKGNVTQNRVSYSFPVSPFLGHNPPLSFSPKHNLFAMKGSSDLSIYDLTKWQEKYKLSIRGYEISFHPKNPRIIAVFTDNFSKGSKYYQIEILDMTQALSRHTAFAKSRWIINEVGIVQKLLFHPTGEILASLMGNEIHIWDSIDTNLIATLSFS